MPKKIKLNGTVVGDRDAWIYDWLEIPYISPSSVHKSLEEAGGDDIDVYISSGGGNAWSGSEIHTALKEYPGFVTVKIPSIAGSAASVIAMAGDKILIAPTAQIMIHNSATWTDGNKEDHQQTMQMLQSVDEAMVNAYESKTGKSREEIRQLMENETFMNAQLAVELGFADEVMFATEEVEPVATANLAAELPPAILDKFRTKILAMNQDNPKTLNQKELTPETMATQPVPEANTKEVLTTMDINELRAKHPELFEQVKAEVKDEAIQEERQRVNSLNALAKAPGAADIVAKAIEAGKTAAEAAIEIVNASTERISSEAQARKEDSEASNAKDVLSQDVDTPEAKAEAEEAQAQSEVDEVTAEIQRLTGGK
ncbi:head maturation protease, ClpP-related [Paenibacillus brevis]|uniref:Clp protease ClpP n=1 Tax=Paenibacillus brevis TaxID=2841508 RepID=A0ABS6FR26_9BACL|nr:head maturation protease, ClpP-related [Paenibacillus brevis]MBU5672636.1 Clp protease ClpP [Paenibacillus brevis]